jgi:hypothetical protein
MKGIKKERDHLSPHLGENSFLILDSNSHLFLSFQPAEAGVHRIYAPNVPCLRASQHFLLS